MRGTYAGPPRGRGWRQRATLCSKTFVSVAVALVTLVVYARVAPLFAGWLHHGVGVGYPLAPPSHTTVDEETPLVIPDIPAEQLDTFALTAEGNTTPLAVNLPYVRHWVRYPRLAICGVLGTDDEARRVMRQAQRLTWATDPAVATRASGFRGPLLLLYVQSLRWATAPYVSARMLAEMEMWEDTLMLQIVTPERTKLRAPGEGGEYGKAFQAMNSRKDILFFRYAYQTFPECPYIVKLDDDSFVHVPEFLRMVREMPRVSTMYGFLRGTTERPFYWGHLMLLTRDVAREIATEPTAQELTAIPFTPALRSRYESLEFFREDLMIGYALFARYGSGKVRRRPPTPAPPHPGLPPPTGWGAAYMAYLQSPSVESRTGVVASPLPATAAAPHRTLNMTYHFPDPATLDSGRILVMGDNCRVAPLWPLAGEPIGEVAQHYALTFEDHQGAMRDLAERERLGRVRRPRLATVLEGSTYTYRMQFMEVCSHKDLVFLFDKRHVNHKRA